MSNQTEDRQVWEKIKKIISINLSVIFTLVIWVALFVSMLIGYFSIPLLIVVIIITYLALRDRFVKTDEEDVESYRDSVGKKKE